LEAKKETVMKVAYWHRELPPVDAEFLGEHTVEATSRHVVATLATRDDLWDRCYRELITEVSARLEQEVMRLGGDYAHVRTETIDTRRNESAGEAWLHGRFGYALLKAGTRQADDERRQGRLAG
jgi:hypothetical protein